MRCPICERQFDPVQSSALPFCGERCRQIDLGRWLGEDYRLPADDAAPPGTFAHRSRYVAPYLRVKARRTGAAPAARTAVWIP